MGADPKLPNVGPTVRRLNPHIFGKEVGQSESTTTERSQVQRPLHVQSLHRTEVSASVTAGGANSAQNTRQFTINTTPVPAPRMTKRDAYRVTEKYPRRPRVQRYFDFQNLLQKEIGDIPIVPDELRAVFHFPMPDSWSKKRRQDMEGKPHRQRPDGDNCMKALQDSLFLEDGSVWKGSFEKRWSVHGKVEIKMIWL